MITITDKQIVDNGLNWVREFDQFELRGNHYWPYPEVLGGILGEYEVKTDYFGSGDQGSTVSTFTRKPSEQQKREAMERLILDIEINYGIKILEWRFV